MGYVVPVLLCRSLSYGIPSYDKAEDRSFADMFNHPIGDVFLFIRLIVESLFEFILWIGQIQTIPIILYVEFGWLLTARESPY